MRRGAGRVATAAGVALIGAFAAPSASGATADHQSLVQLVVALSPAAAGRPVGVLGELPGSLPNPIVAHRWTLEVPMGEVAATLARLRATPGVDYATAAHTVHATTLPSSPDDPCYTGTCGVLGSSTTVIDPDASLSPTGGPPYQRVQASQPDLTQVGAPTAWSITHGSSSVLVAVLDTGVDAEQQDLAANGVTAGPDVCSADDSACNAPNGGDTSDTDDNGHGTHVTGTIGAATGNGEGVASLGWGTRVETYKVLDGSGAGSTTDLATGIYDAVGAGASVINMSLGDNPCTPQTEAGGLCGPDPDTQAAVQFALAHDVVVVAAAGNDGSDLPSYPASYPGVLSVAAVNGGGRVDDYSEWGGSANIAAPGDNILSTWNTDANGLKSSSTYAVLTGTSMASPHVAAAAALVRSANPSLSAAQVTSILESTAGPTHGGNPISGGVLDAGSAVQAALSPPPYSGYRLAANDGSVYDFGASPALGDLSGTALARPIVAFASRRDETGYWEAGSDGGVFSFGSAGYFGSTGNIRLTRPIVGMQGTPDGGGYWLVASDGGVFAFGDAGYFGSTGAIRLNKPVVGMVATNDGRGYWLVASDGGIFAFGDAAFEGSTGGVRLNKPVVGMQAATGGGGYLLVASDGGIFAFGSAVFEGSTGAITLAKPIVGALATSDGRGYWLVASDGGVFTFGDARYSGSLGGQSVPPVVAIG